jgi:hypothetical protein
VIINNTVHATAACQRFWKLSTIAHGVEKKMQALNVHATKLAVAIKNVMNNFGMQEVRH